MTIASEITRIQSNIAAAYTAASGKGATLPATENSDNLATCIGSISGGASPTGLKVNVTFKGGTTWDDISRIEISKVQGEPGYILYDESYDFLPIILSNIAPNSTIYYVAEPEKSGEISPSSGSITLQGSYAELNFVVSPS
jgi:hypothetical protein